MLNIDELIKESFKNQKFTELKVYRLLKSMITNFKTQKNAPEYTEAVEVSIIRKYIQQSEEAKQQYEEAGRTALVKESEDEITILKELLPEEVQKIDVYPVLNAWCVVNGFLQLGTGEMPQIPKKSMGIAIKAMKEAFPTADGKMISEVVKEFVV